MARWVDLNALGPKGRLQLWIEEQVLAISDLRGRSIARWIGTEMAMREEGPGGIPLFHDPAIPYLQVCHLYLDFVEGGGRNILTYQNIWTDGWGLCIDVLYGGPPDEFSEEKSIFRTRDLKELPVGKIGIVRVSRDENGDIVEVSLEVEGAWVTLWSGEIYEESNGGLRVVRPDESILVAVQRE